MTQRRFFKLPLLYFFILYFSLTAFSDVMSAETTQYGAVVICSLDQKLDPTSVLPEVAFLGDAQNEGWTLVKGDAYTGIDRRRFYFTVEAPKAGLSAPTVEVKWKGVKLERVIGSKDAKFALTDDGVRFTMLTAKTPTGAFTEISIGAVRLGVFHNWDVRRAGPYREGDYPYEQIKAQLNYMLGALEVCRAYGWTDSDKLDFVDHINLYGFETHFPNGHRDYPPHFHIMLGWDGWQAANVGHYLLDEHGKIVKNAYWVLHEDVEKIHVPNVVSQYTDKTGRDVFDTTILNDGSGLVFKKIGAAKEYLIHEGANGAAESVVVAERKSDSQDEWKKLCEVQATDDSVHGKFTSNARYFDSSSTVYTIEFNYDPDTGAKL